MRRAAAALLQGACSAAHQQCSTSVLSTTPACLSSSTSLSTLSAASCSPALRQLSLLARQPAAASDPARTSRDAAPCAATASGPSGALRHYAKAAAAPAKAAAPAADAPKRHRTGMTKLYSCRNDRLRHTHEQIWPTLALTDDEAAMFRRNSRLFVVDMGKGITLQNKFRMAGGGAASGLPSKVPYQGARPMLHESNLHLDALGENPRYLRIRRLGSMYATKLQNVRKLRLLLGFQRRKVLQRMYEHALVASGPHRMWKLVCAMESNLAMFATRCGLAEDVVGALNAVKHNHVSVNGHVPAMKYRGYLVPGDVVAPAAGGSRGQLQGRIARGLGQDFLDSIKHSYA